MMSHQRTVWRKFSVEEKSFSLISSQILKMYKISQFAETFEMKYTSWCFMPHVFSVAVLWILPTINRNIARQTTIYLVNANGHISGFDINLIHCCSHDTRLKEVFHWIILLTSFYAIGLHLLLSNLAIVTFKRVVRSFPFIHGK